MAEIYDENGAEMTVGLQSSTACDNALHVAKWMASEWGEPMFLEDGDERLTVWPDGCVENGWEGDWD